ncbi:ankyrin repeat and protein kinase domain-containing protein 1 [Colletotrichum simmondsii]|uniref:Ankyrin repeat and protein kinase domain-containing protein 1 n=1 Tax=Colletotrichum simmondsii TaxID=703756 RepID=A0A135RS98_9PEZI|nr:ankyrin repeat and protein kinase domain-containing protein 1 [Colletotrichum simmondsii]
MRSLESDSPSSVSTSNTLEPEFFDEDTEEYVTADESIKSPVSRSRSDDEYYEGSSENSTWRRSYSLYEFENVDEGIQFYEARQASQEEQKGNELDLMQTRLMLGRAYAAAGRNTDAETTLLKAQHWMEDICGWDSVNTIHCTKSLVNIFERLEKHTEAAELYRRATKGVEETLGTEYPWTLDLKNDWACYCARISDLEAAEDLFYEVWESKRHALATMNRKWLRQMEIAVEALREEYDEDGMSIGRAMTHLYFLYTKSRTQENRQHSAEILKKVLRGIGPKWGKRTFRSLEWTRGFIEKWFGMDVKTLADRLGFHDAAGKRAFRKGVESGSEAVVRLFLDLKVRLDAPDDVEKTALHDAAELGHYHVAKLLLDVGADADAIDRNGHVPIDLALKENHESIVRLLIGHNGGILTSFDATTRLLSRKKRRHSDEKHRTGFNATVVHFYDKPGTGDAHRVERLPVEELVWNEAESFDNIFEGKTETECKTEYYPKAEFRWIHLPANCMSWVLYVWLKALQSAGSKAKAEGIEWKKRQFVVGHFLDKRQKSRNDVEQQRIEEQSSTTQSDEDEGDREDRLQDRTENSGIGRVADPSTTSSREIARDKST